MYMSLEQLSIFHQVTHFITVPISVAIGAWYGPRYGYSRKDAMSYSAIMMAIIVVFTYACKWVPAWFGYTVYINAARTFMFIPLFTWVLKEPSGGIGVLHGADFVTPNIFFVRTVVLIGCTSLGCGEAVPADWGIYSPTQGQYVFPMDLIDLIATFLIGVGSLIYAKKLNYQGGGRIFGAAVFALGVVRALIQFGSTVAWWGIRGFNDETVYSIVSIITCIVIFAINNKKVSVRTEECI